MSRLQPLDWLRGLLAVSIMIYHLTGWKLYHPEANTLLGRLGIYGVSMFFILSGLAMAATYHDFVRDSRTSLRFFVRRIFRIWPLLWLAVTAATLGAFVLKARPVDWTLVFLNLTTLFGFIDPIAYINTGAWSIGNEMVYYALTPLFLLAYRRGLWLGNLLVAVATIVGLYFAFSALTPDQSLASQWRTYINPFNNLCLYAAGLALFFNARHLVLKPAAGLCVLAVSALVLAFYPATGDLIVTVTGGTRVVFVLASIAVVFSFYKLTLSLPTLVSAPLSALGAATYGVYLLHPVVFPGVEFVLRMAGSPAHPALSMGATAALTIVLALGLYRYFELPLIRLGKRLTPDSMANAGAADMRASSRA